MIEKLTFANNFIRHQKTIFKQGFWSFREHIKLLHFVLEFKKLYLRFD